MPAPPAENFALCRDRLLFALLVTLRAKTIDAGLHARQQRFSRQGIYPGPPQGQNLFALAQNLRPHSLYFSSEVGQIRHSRAPMTMRHLRTKPEHYKPLAMESTLGHEVKFVH